MMSGSVKVDHVAMRVGVLQESVEQWRAKGFSVSFRNPSLAVVEVGDGVRLALLGEGAGHPNHVALCVATEEELLAKASLEGAEPETQEDGSRVFYSRGGIGIAVEWVWRPFETNSFERKE